RGLVVHRARLEAEEALQLGLLLDERPLDLDRHQAPTFIGARAHAEDEEHPDDGGAQGVHAARISISKRHPNLQLQPEARVVLLQGLDPRREVLAATEHGELMGEAQLELPLHAAPAEKSDLALPADLEPAPAQLVAELDVHRAAAQLDGGGVE